MTYRLPPGMHLEPHWLGPLVTAHWSVPVPAHLRVPDPPPLLPYWERYGEDAYRDIMRPFVMRTYLPMTDEQLRELAGHPDASAYTATLCAPPDDGSH